MHCLSGSDDGRRQKKKLADAAHWWAEGGAQNDSPEDAQDDLAALGATPAQIAELADAAGDEPAEQHFGVWEENWETVLIFLRLSTQWRYGGMGGAIGLDYPALESVLRMRRVKNRGEMLDQLRVMERAALGVMNKS